MAKLTAKELRDINYSIADIKYVLDNALESNPDYLTFALDASGRVHKALLALRPNG